MTPHIESSLEDIANIVIMPGDPKRVEYIAKNYLTDYKLVNSVRGELAYTGYYKGKRLTVFSSGMGIPSMGIYSHELFTVYNVDTIIRIGSAGSYTSNLNVKDLFLVESAYSDSNYALTYCNGSEKIVYSNNELNNIIKETANKLNINLKGGRVHSTESFYTESINMESLTKEYSCDCVEMETFSLFINASVNNKKATSLLTISDSFITKESLTSEERETNFNEMIKLALESTLNIK